MNGKDDITVTFTEAEWRAIIRAFEIIREKIVACINPGCDLTDPRKKDPGF